MARNEDLMVSVSDMSYDELSDKVRSIREGRVNPVPVNETKVKRKSTKKKDSLLDLFKAMTPEDQKKFLAGNK